MTQFEDELMTEELPRHAGPAPKRAAAAATAAATAAAERPARGSAEVRATAGASGAKDHQ